MDTNKLQDILVKHKMYVNGEQGGVRANLCNADLRGVNLNCVDLTYADLRGVNLNCADLTCADLCKVILSGADLTEADLTGANLSSANLIDAKLMYANLRGANLSGANLSSANLIDAKLMYANLRGANLSGANLHRSDLSGAIGIVSFGPIGKNRRIGYAVKHDNAVMIQLGCFWGTLAEARVAIQNKYGENSTYAALVIAAANALLL